MRKKLIVLLRWMASLSQGLPRLKPLAFTGTIERNLDSAFCFMVVKQWKIEPDTSKKGVVDHYHAGRFQPTDVSLGHADASTSLQRWGYKRKFISELKEKSDRAL